MPATNPTEIAVAPKAGDPDGAHDTSKSRSGQTPDARHLLRLWLGAVALLIALTAIVGAATRLTGSGLSITEWNPIMGVVPPLTEADWRDAFAKYQAIPQYQQLNKGMSLAAFRSIFWWEWGHRLLARAIGVLVLLPLLGFWALGLIPRGLVPRLVGLLALGGLQGAIGWYMVRSGLVDRVDVSQYRLALHLGLAIAIFGVTLWTLFELAPRHAPAPGAVTRGQHRMAAVLAGLVYLQTLLGALVAGLKAGRTFNTWPLMDGAIIPSGLGQMSPLWHNLFENPALVQLNHRLLAYALIVMAIGHALSMNRTPDTHVSRSAAVLAVVMLTQAALGIWTLLAWVPTGLGVAHQAGALLTFAAALRHLFAIRRADRV